VKKLINQTVSYRVNGTRTPIIRGKKRVNNNRKERHTKKKKKLTAGILMSCEGRMNHRQQQQE
jgi:hypothetical protein